MKKNQCFAIFPRWLAPFFLSVFLLLGTYPAAAQTATERVVSGRVTDESTLPVPGVTIRLKGSNATAATTDINGNYSINLAGGKGSTLVFSFIGMKTKEVELGETNKMSVVLQGETYGLKEVVAIGYGVSKKKDLTGSVSTVDGAELAKRNTTQLSQALQGTMPGVMVTRTSSEPGASATVNIRGITTISTSTPLVIIDGVPGNSLDDVNANDIQSISVLKDGASAAIYGSRAAAGVILVTTKRPQAGQLSLQYTANLGIDKPTTFPKVVGVDRYLAMIDEFTWNDANNTPGGQYSPYTKDQVDNWVARNKTNPNDYPITDWESVLLNSHAIRNTHNLEISAGSETIKTQASINYENDNAIYDYRNFQRVMSRVNNSFVINKYLTANIDLSFSHSLNNAPVIDPVWDALRYAPIYAATWADGRIAQGQNGSNAYAQLQDGGFDDTWTNKFTGRISLEIRPIKDLTFTGVYSPYMYNVKEKDFVKQISWYSKTDPSQLGGLIAGNLATSLNETRNDGSTYTKQFLANYVKNINKNHFNVLAGYEDFSSFDESLSASGNNYILSDFPYLSLAPADYLTDKGSATESAYRSVFGRLLYDYANKYFLQANIRSDESSRFAPGYRRATFPSISAGWAMSEESFMKNNNVFSYLKLRGSWGQLGNERIGSNYPYQASIDFNESGPALFSQGGGVVSSLTAAQTTYAIHNITWETTETKDVGLDAYFLNNRLMFTGDYYNKRTKNMLLLLDIPDYIGYKDPQQNAGIMTTKGWDIQLAWRDKINDFKYSVSVNLSDYKSVMGDLAGTQFVGSQIIKQGSQYNEWYGYVADGLYQTAADVAASPKLYASVKPGDVKYKDISGPNGVPDGKITPDYDRVLLGGSLPRYLYGGNINAEYKGFDLSVAFQGIGQKNSMLTTNMVKPFMSAWMNAPQIIDGKYWSVYNTPEQNLAAKYPRLSYTSGENNNYVTSSYWLTSGAYFRVKNITVGYTLPQSLTSKLTLKSVRIFASGSDLFTADHLPQGWDPEVNYDTYISKTFNFGLSVKF